MTQAQGGIMHNVSTWRPRAFSSGRLVATLMTLFLVEMHLSPPFSDAQNPSAPKYEREVLKTISDRVKAIAQESLDNLRAASKEDVLLNQQLQRVQIEVSPHLGSPSSARAYRTDASDLISLDLSKFGEVWSVASFTAFAITRPSGVAAILQSILLQIAEDARAAQGAGELYEIPDFGGFLEKYVRTDQVEALNRVAAYFQAEFMTWMMLHEIAHHVLDHTGKPKKDQSSEQLQKDERSADSWAFEVMHKLGYPLVYLREYLSIEALLDQVVGISGAQYRSEHPGWVERYANLLAFMTSTPPVGQPIHFWAYQLFSQVADFAGELIEYVYWIPSRSMVESGQVVAISISPPSGSRAREVTLFAVEYEGHSAVLYKTDEVNKRRLVIRINNPSEYESITLTTVVDLVTNTKRDSYFFGHRHWLGHQYITTLQGYTIPEMLRLVTPIDFAVGILKKIENRPSVLEAVERSMRANQKKLAGTLIRQAKGELAYQESLGRLALIDSKGREEVDAILGKEGGAAFEAALLADPLFRSGLDQIQQLSGKGNQLQRK